MRFVSKCLVMVSRFLISNNFTADTEYAACDSQEIMRGNRIQML